MKKRKRQKKSLFQSLFALAFSFVIYLLWQAMEVRTVSHQPESGKPAELYSNQTRNDLRGMFLAGIRDAKQSVLLIIYALTDSSLQQALKEKAQQGVDVHVICDPKACPNIVRRLGPKVRVHKHFSSGLMHQKILVVDKSKTWIGSANMTGESLRAHGNLVTAFHSPAMAGTIAQQATCLVEQEKGSQMPCQQFSIGDQKVELWFLPDNPYAVDRILDLIRSAQKTIQVAMFTFTRLDFAQALIEAKRRGIQTRVAVDYHSGQGASSSVVNTLKANGIDVRLSPSNTLLHHKFLYVDHKLLVNGSANWTKAAFTKNNDCFIILHDLTPAQRNEMDALWQVIEMEGQ